MKNWISLKDKTPPDYAYINIILRYDNGMVSDYPIVGFYVSDEQSIFILDDEGQGAALNLSEETSFYGSNDGGHAALFWSPIPDWSDLEIPSL